MSFEFFAAGKLAALFSRKQARDLFDCCKIFKLSNLDKNLLRIAFIVYGGMNRRDWRTVTIEDVTFENNELKRELFPMLQADVVKKLGNPEEFGKRLVSECRESLKTLLPFTEKEKQFFNLLLDEGKIEASILTADEEMRNNIIRQPLLEWKALNVIEHKGSG